MTFLLLLILSSCCTLIAVVSSEQLDTSRSLLQSAPALAPLGSILPNSDPSCDPLWAYQTGCYSDYTCLKGPICSCKDGSRCTDSTTGYTGIFICPCDEAPQTPQPPPTPAPPPPPPPNCVEPQARCPPAYSQTEATQRCDALGGSLKSNTSRTYSCTCCIGFGNIFPSKPPPSPPQPNPPPPKHFEDPGAAIRRRVGIITGCSIGGSLLLALLMCACVLCRIRSAKRRNDAAFRRNNDLERPPPFTQNGPSAHQWFEPGYRGTSFKTTQDGLFILSGRVRKNMRFDEFFAQTFTQGAGPSHAAESRASNNAWTETRAGEAPSTPLSAVPDYKENGKGKADVPDPEPASIEGLPEDEICIVCCNAPKECVFVPCGHHATCLACGRLCQQQAGKGCPVCRRPIERVLKIYEA